MRDFRFLHAADIHLGGGLAGLAFAGEAARDALAEAQRRAFVNLVDAAVGETGASAAADFVVIAGDLYDGPWRDMGVAVFARAQLRRLTEAGVAVFLVKGNHDADSEIADALPPPEGAQVFSSRAPQTRRLEALRVAIHGQSFPRRHVPEDLSRGYPDPIPGWFNIGVLHTSLDGRPGHAAYAPCSVAGLRARGYDYWALGHVHARETLGEDPLIAYPGCLQGRHVRETGPKGALRVDVRDGRAQAEFLALDAARWAAPRIDLTGVETEAARRAALETALRASLDAAEGRMAILRLRYVGAAPLDAALRRMGRAALLEEAAAMAAGLSDALAIEGVEIDTDPPRARDPVLLAPFAPALSEAAADPELHTALAAEIAEFSAKAPHDARPDDRDPAALIAEARRLLLARADDDAATDDGARDAPAGRDAAR